MSRSILISGLMLSVGLHSAVLLPGLAFGRGKGGATAIDADQARKLLLALQIAKQAAAEAQGAEAKSPKASSNRPEPKSNADDGEARKEPVASPQEPVSSPPQGDAAPAESGRHSASAAAGALAGHVVNPASQPGLTQTTSGTGIASLTQDRPSNSVPDLVFNLSDSRTLIQAASRAGLKFLAARIVNGNAYVLGEILADPAGESSEDLRNFPQSDLYRYTNRPQKLPQYYLGGKVASALRRLNADLYLFVPAQLDLRYQERQIELLRRHGMSAAQVSQTPAQFVRTITGDYELRIELPRSAGS